MDTTPTKRLYRSRTNKMIAGVCGGLGEYFDIDPLIFRLIFVILLISGGAGVLIYLILMIVIPEEPKTDNPGNPSEPHDRAKEFANDLRDGANRVAQEIRGNMNSGGKSSRRNIVGIIIVAIGIIALINVLFPQSWVRWDIFWPVIIILIGVAIITRRR